jgi:hypothetical protein
MKRQVQFSLPTRRDVCALLSVGLFLEFSPFLRAMSHSGLPVQGMVVDSEDGSPIESAVVRLDRLPGNVALDETTTDHDGKFAFSDLESGEYIIRTEKARYVEVFPGSGASQDITYTGERLALRLSLVRTSVITGRVFDSLGQPREDARVIPMRRGAVGVETRLHSAGDGARSDDRGVFRLYDLTPGLYTLAVVPAEQPALASFAPMYFPGVADPSRAEFFEVRPGETRAVDVSLPTAEVQEIKGTVVGIPPDWADHRVAVALMPSAGIVRLFQSTLTDKEGHFSFPAVPLGSYRVVAYGPVIARGPDGPMTGGNSRQGAVRIEVPGGQSDTVVIALSRGAIIEVRGVLEAKNLLAPPCFGAVKAILRPLEPVPVQFESFSARLTKQSSVIREVPVGRYWVDLVTGDNSCFAEKVTFGSQQGPVIDVGEDGTLVFVLSTRRGNVTGIVVGQDGSAEAGAHVILTSSSPATLSLQTRSTQADEKGCFSLQRVFPGHYRILAVRKPDSTKYIDPLFWDQHGVREIQVKSDVTVNAEVRMMP